MKGQTFTVAKLHYVNGLVYFIAEHGGNVDFQTLAAYQSETTKRGDRTKHPDNRVRTLARLAEGLGLVTRADGMVELTDLGFKYYQAKTEEKWSLSDEQKKLLGNRILSDPEATPTIYAIASLLSLIQEGYWGRELARKFAAAIGKEDDWNSDATYEGYTGFGINYLKELGFISEDGALRKTWSAKPRKPAKAILFTWNPNKWQWNDLPQAAYQVNVEGQLLGKWSCGVTKNISPGDRAFLIRLGAPPKGMIGSGTIVSESFAERHWDSEKAKNGDTVNYVQILFDSLSEEPVLDEEMLASGKLGGFDWFPQKSGNYIPEEIAEELESVWSQLTGSAYIPPESPEISKALFEGSKKQTSVTSYERNPEAREKCLKHYGYQCRVCGLSFAERYGEIGKGFIHVHHLVNVSSKGHEYEIDPINDLRPVCPNCHAMLHKRTPPYTIAELKGMIRNQP